MLWRRASRQLRWVRGTRSHAGVRRQRLRRDEPGSVRVGCEAPGHELRDRGPVEGSLAEDRSISGHALRALLPGSHGRVRRPRPTSMSGTRASTSTRSSNAGGNGPVAKRSGASSRWWPRPSPRTAPRRSPSWRARSTASSASSATRRSSFSLEEVGREEHVELDSSQLRSWLYEQFDVYRRALPTDHRHVLESYRLVDFARKVVGVGSVGTRCWIALLLGRDDADPLFLQIKEANASVLEPYTVKSEFASHGQRVVEGQRLLQAASDILLSWATATGFDGVDRSFYVRQLWDWKISADLETITPKAMKLYSEICGWTLARGHARSGDRVAIAAYLGSSRRVRRIHRRLRDGLRRPEPTRLRNEQRSTPHDDSVGDVAESRSRRRRAFSVDAEALPVHRLAREVSE